MITHKDLRQLFSQFWQSKGHKEVPPIPLVPKDDPTTLFTGSGMQQLVPYLLGEPHPLGKKLFNIQPCVRVQDIEEVGDNRHDTIFEMMGNWSLGTYFKEEQLNWFFEFLVDVLKFDPHKLYVTVFAGNETVLKDTESIEIWKNIYKKYGLDTKVSKRIYEYDDNWWSRAKTFSEMPPGEPGGPDSEVFYEFTNVHHDPKFGEKCHPNCGCGRFSELGNSVFMQYKKNVDGTFTELPKKNVDFGGGLERIVTAASGDPDMFKTDLFSQIIKKIEIETDKKYQGNEYLMRIIADHIKSSTLMIINGITPSNKEQGYVLRRLLRRSSIKMKKLTRNNVLDFSRIVDGVLSTYDGVMSINKKDQQHTVTSVINTEMQKFNQSLDRGLKEIQKLERIDGKEAFNLYQSYGFPLELTQEILKERGQKIDKKQFYEEFEKHKNLSRTASTGKFKGGLADHSVQVLKYHSATHLLHQALFDVLGNDIKQEGSNITGERLRFDYYSPAKPTSDQLKKVEEIVNAKIADSLPVEFKIMPKDEALKIGAKSFFREKYPEQVKVYFIGNYSKEFCGGPHVKNTKEIGTIKIFKTETIGNNLYRIYAQ